MHHRGQQQREIRKEQEEDDGETKVPRIRHEQQQHHHKHHDDRNFDDLKDLFHERIYGTVKGQYRISMTIQDIESQLATAEASTVADELQQEQQQEGQNKKTAGSTSSRSPPDCFSPPPPLHSSSNRPRLLTALDIGGGLGQMTLHLAKSGRFRQVDYFDISQDMKTYVDRQISEAREKGELQQDHPQKKEEVVAIVTHVGGLKDAISNSNIGEDFLQPDVVCLHAVLEWLANPMDDFEALLNYMKKGSMLSLLYYNKISSCNLGENTPQQQQQPKGKLKKKDRKPSPLTPYHEFCHDEIEGKLVQCGFEITIRTGLRVKKFHKKGKCKDNTDLVKYLEEEQTIARIEPYYWQGRYNHVIAVKKR